MNRRIVLGLLLMVALGVGGCVRVYRVVDEPIVGGRTDWSQAQTGAAIVKALVARNWVLQKEEPGTMEAFFQKGRATVTVEIRYTADSYSLEPVGHQGVRTKKMNQWVRNLQKRIRKELASRFDDAGSSSDGDESD